MKNKIGLVAKIDKNSPDNLSDDEWRYKFNYLRDSEDSLIVFNWEDLREDGEIPQYVYGDKRKVELKLNGNINNICDILVIGQMGPLYERKSDFFTFLKRLNNFSGRIINPLESIYYNISKKYLMDLSANGISVVPTRDVNGNSLNVLKSMKFPNQNSIDLVIKPKILGECGKDVRLISSFKNQEEFEIYLDRVKDAIFQPLISKIYNFGEDSLVFVDGKLVNCVNKFSGKMKVNECAHEGNVIYTKKRPLTKQLEVAKKVMDVWPTNFDYMRIDLINSEIPLVSEVEIINPSCYEIDVGIMSEFNSHIKKLIDKIKNEI